MEDFFRESGVKWLWEKIKNLLSTKQDKLVSGINIKTINGKSVLGSGDVSIEGGGDFDSSGTYPNLTAGKATNATTAESMREDGLSWSDKNIVNGLTLIDSLFLETVGNRLGLCAPESIVVEYSQDNGVTWEDYNLSDSGKTVLVTPATGVSTLYLGKRTDKYGDDQLRIPIDAQDGNLYFRISKLLFKISDATADDRNNGYPTHCKVSFQRNKDYGTDTWESGNDSAVVGGNTWVSFTTVNLPIFGGTSGSYIRKIRLTFYMPNGCGSYKCRVRNIALIGQTVTTVANTFAKTGHLYTFDYQQNATFPANVTATKLITKGGTNQQVVLGDGSLRAISELSPITDADADILLDNHIHSIDVNANGNNVNISVIESTKNGNAWETTEKNVTIPVATQDTAGVISAADKKKINSINYKDNTIFVGDGMNGTLSIGYESSKASAYMRVQRDRYSSIHVTSFNDTTGGSIAVMESNGGKGRMEVNGDQFAELVLSGAGQVRATLTKENEDGTNIETIIDAAEGITAPKLATIGGTSEQILLGDGTLITFDELKAKLGLI